MTFLATFSLLLNLNANVAYSISIAPWRSSPGVVLCGQKPIELFDYWLVRNGGIEEGKLDFSRDSRTPIPTPWDLPTLKEFPDTKTVLVNLVDRLEVLDFRRAWNFRKEIPKILTKIEWVGKVDSPLSPNWSPSPEDQSLFNLLNRNVDGPCSLVAPSRIFVSDFPNENPRIQVSTGVWGKLSDSDRAGFILRLAIQLESSSLGPFQPTAERNYSTLLALDKTLKLERISYLHFLRKIFSPTSRESQSLSYEWDELPILVSTIQWTPQDSFRQAQIATTDRIFFKGGTIALKTGTYAHFDLLNRVTQIEVKEGSLNFLGKFIKVTGVLAFEGEELSQWTVLDDQWEWSLNGCPVKFPKNTRIVTHKGNFLSRFLQSADFSLVANPKPILSFCVGPQKRAIRFKPPTLSVPLQFSFFENGQLKSGIFLEPETFLFPGNRSAQIWNILPVSFFRGGGLQRAQINSRSIRLLVDAQSETEFKGYPRLSFDENGYVTGQE